MRPPFRRHTSLKSREPGMAMPLAAHDYALPMDGSRARSGSGILRRSSAGLWMHGASHGCKRRYAIARIGRGETAGIPTQWRRRSNRPETSGKGPAKIMTPRFGRIHPPHRRSKHRSGAGANLSGSKQRGRAACMLPPHPPMRRLEPPS